MIRTIDWSEAAYSSAATFKPRNSRYIRFPTAADAIRYAIEDLPSSALRSLSMESGDDRHQGEAIRALYDAPDFPLERAKR